MLGIDGFAANVTWFLPGTLLAVLVGFLVRRRAGQLLGGGPLLGWAVIVAVGIIVAATLTPLRAGATVWHPPISGCDFSRMWFASRTELLRFDDPFRNIVLFIPLGLVLPFASGWLRRVLLVAAAALLPVAIETTQLLVVPLDRSCQSSDVFDNVTGLAVGLVIGSLVVGAVKLVQGASGRTHVDRPGDAA